MKVAALGEYVLRNGGLASVTSLVATTAIGVRGRPKKITQAWGTAGEFPMIWDARSGYHSAGAHALPGSKAASQFDIIREKRRVGTNPHRGRSRPA